MRFDRSQFITRAAGLLLGGLALAACDPKILLGEFGESEGEQSGGGDEGGPQDGTEGQSSGGSGQGQSSGGSGEGESSGGGSSESATGGGETGSETGTTGGETTGGDECDAWLQDCPTGQKCAPYYSGGGGSSWDAWRCVDLDPTPEEVGSSCHVTGDFNSGEDDCEIGAVCWDADPVTFEGTCVALCAGSPQSPTCAAGMNCTVLNDGQLNICLPDCDPLLQDCGSGDTCIPLFSTDRFICVLDASGAEGQAFDDCEYANACDPGFICATTESASECSPMASGCCIPFCDTTQLDGCPGLDQVCLPWFEPMQAPPGKGNVGICGLEP